MGKMKPQHGHALLTLQHIRVTMSAYDMAYFYETQDYICYIHTSRRR